MDVGKQEETVLIKKKSVEDSVVVNAEKGDKDTLQRKTNIKVLNGAKEEMKLLKVIVKWKTKF